MKAFKEKNKYPPESAGGKMIANVPFTLLEETVLDVKKRLFEKAKEFETLNYIYVVNKDRRLLGVFSFREIFQAPEETKIKNLMIKKEVIKVYPYTDQEKVAILALKHNLKAIPVVDKESRFLGVVPSNKILGILYSEHMEDIFRYAGIYDGDFLPSKMIRAPAGTLAKVRLPWLILGLFGGILAAKITGLFEAPLKSHFILAAFIPVIVYMADAVGTQTEALVIRGLAIDSKLAIKNYLFQEIKVGFLIALSLGALLTLISSLWLGLLHIGFILGVSIFLTIMAAIIIALFIPLVLNKLKKDPALGSGPFATIVTDLCSLIIYFSVSTFLFKVFGI